MTRTRILSRLSPTGLLGAATLSASANAQETYSLEPTAKTVAWGCDDAKAAPALRVKAGDTTELQTLLTNSPKRLDSGYFGEE